ncbi:MAG: ABC transporter ATP-binding protein [Alphaproteobacteria bacterium]
MTADGQPLIAFREVSRVYGEGETEVRALDRVSLTIEDGDFVAVMGPSGSGKSTAMNIIGCLDTPTGGAYLFRGVSVGTLDRRQRALLRRFYIGFVFQGFNLLKRTSALRNVEMPLIYRGLPGAERRAKAMEALRLVGLEGREHHSSSELSGGQQQRVAIARALVTQPEVLVADEPTGNLDSERSHDVMRLIERINREQGVTVVLVTHEPDIAAYAKRVILFLDGHVEADERKAGPDGEGV